MEFWTIFFANLKFAIIMIIIYFGIIYFAISHYLKEREEFLSENDSILFKSMRFKKISNFVIVAICFAMVLYLLGALGLIIYDLATYYLSLMDVSMIS